MVEGKGNDSVQVEAKGKSKDPAEVEAKGKSKDPTEVEAKGKGKSKDPKEVEAATSAKGPSQDEVEPYVEHIDSSDEGEAEEHKLLDLAKYREFKRMMAKLRKKPQLLNVTPLGRWSCLMQVAMVDPG